MQKAYFTVSFLSLLLFAPALRADEVTRQVQEELRRRHLYYNEIDGRSSVALSLALRRYQQRKDFAVTGQADEQTLRSLGIDAEPAPPAEGGDSYPDEPVLRSDAAVREGPHEGAPIRAANPSPVTRKQADEFVRRYLAACESPSLEDELSLYADRVDYYDHGVVDRQYVRNELTVYDQRWPTRKYALISPVGVSHAHGQAEAKFRVAFQVSNITAMAKRSAAGRTEQTFGLGRRPDGNLEIVSVREQRVRRPRSRRQLPPVMRSVRRVFRGIFH